MAWLIQPPARERRATRADCCAAVLALLAGCAGSDIAGTGLGGADASIDLAAAPIDAATPARDQSLAPTDLAVSPDLVPPADLLPAADLLPPRAGPGEACDRDEDCASDKCIDIYMGNRFCAIPCNSQMDCDPYLNLFCESQFPNGLMGYCIPRSPAHCSSCVRDIDCGSLAERCLTAPGDIAPACHIDCALAGAAACPADYTCTAVADGNVQRRLCLPNGKVCLDSLGGYCDRVGLPQACSRTNVTGVCTGQRTCLVNAKRYDRCNALAPQYRLSCQMQDPAGCMLAVDPNALKDKLNCGACGKACPQGQDCCTGACISVNTLQNCGACGRTCAGQTNTSDAACNNGVCDMTCRGNNYDVDKSTNNGCEVLDGVPPGHSSQTAVDRGHKPCDDGGSSDELIASIPSDSRVHTGIDNTFSGAVGAAPDWWLVHADGGNFCLNDYAVTFTTKGGGNIPCYTVTITTDKGPHALTIAGTDTGAFSGGPGAYSSGTPIYFKVEKSCNLPVQEYVVYSVRYHL